jgi:hypothetical protein
MTEGRGSYGPNMNGRLDPEAMTPSERRVKAPGRAAVQRARRRSLSPLIRALQAAADRALGGR